MKITAVICIRDDDDYVENCLSHLLDNGVDYAVIDNGMGVAGRALLNRRRYRRGLVGVWQLPFEGVFELSRQIEKKEDVFAAIEADWLIHLDVDEVMHSYRDGESLSEAVGRIDAQGFNAIDFDEYVFLPVDGDYRPGRALQPLRHYYFFQPSRPRLVRARKKSAGLSFLAPMNGRGGGHTLFGAGLNAAPETFALRHYIVRSEAHARTKYTGRVFSAAELALGWHWNRVGRDPDCYRLPPAEALAALARPGSRSFDRSNPRRRHYWQWGPGSDAVLPPASRRA